MMTLFDIHQKLDQLSPFELQEKWDNSGLILGSFDDQITRAVLSLDIDAEMIETEPEGTLFIVHHPLIFGTLSTLDFDTYPANLIQKMIVKNQKMIAMHTNFDQTHLNAYVMEQVLGLKIEAQLPFLCYAKIERSAQAFIEMVQERLGLATLKYVEGKSDLSRVALCTGSGASLIGKVDADIFLTGDIKYHDAMTAKSLNLAMLDIGHFESERYFSEVLAPLLQDWPISVIISSSKNPFVYN